MVPIRAIVPILVLATACAARRDAPKTTTAPEPPPAAAPDPDDDPYPEPDDGPDGQPDPDGQPAPGGEPDAGDGAVSVIVIDDVGPAPMVMAPPPRPALGSMIADILTGPSR